MNPTTTKSTEEQKTKSVLCRFEPDELEQMKKETGADADATAVACYCRKNLRAS